VRSHPLYKRHIHFGEGLLKSRVRLAVARVARPDHEQQAGILGKFACKAAGRLNRAARSLVTICNQVGY
jgi:hypothetical protein